MTFADVFADVGTTLQGVPETHLVTYRAAIAAATRAGLTVEMDCHSYLAGISAYPDDGRMIVLWDPEAVERETDGEPEGWHLFVQDVTDENYGQQTAEIYGLSAADALKEWAERITA